MNNLTSIEKIENSSGETIAVMINGNVSYNCNMTLRIMDDKKAWLYPELPNYGVLFQCDDFRSIEVDGQSYPSEVELREATEYLKSFKSGGGASVTGEKRLIVTVQKNGINSVVFPQVFAYESPLTVANVVLSGGAASASFKVDVTSYSEATLTGVVIPVGSDITTEDIDIKAGYDLASATIIFNL